MLKLFAKHNTFKRRDKKDITENNNHQTGKTIYFSYKKKFSHKSRYKPNKSYKKISFGRHLYILYFVSFIFVAFLGIILVRSLNVGHINCQTIKSEDCEYEIIEALNKHKNSKLYFSYDLIYKDLTKEPSVEDFTIRFDIFRLGWNIKITQKTPQYIITNSHDFITVAENGYVISNAEPTNLYLPTLYVQTDLPESGVLLDRHIVFALTIIKDFMFMYNIDSGTLTPDGLVIELDSKKRVLFPLEGDRDVLVGGVMYVLGRISNESKTTKQEKDLLLSGVVIDMRFENPVLRPFVN